MNYKQQFRGITSLLYMLIVIICMVMVNFSVQAQTFTPASVPDATFPTGLTDYSAGASAYAINTRANTNNFLYVHTWDAGPGLVGSAGIAAQEFVGDATTGALVLNHSVDLPQDDIMSLEAVIVEDVNHTTNYVVAVYYKNSTSTYEIDVYKWDNVTMMGLVQELGFPQAIDPALTVGVQPGWVRIDAIGHENFAITWTDNGSLFVTACHVWNAWPITFVRSNPMEIINADYPLFDQPDIALSSTRSGIQTYISCTDDVHENMLVFQLPFSTILATPVTPTPFPYTAAALIHEHPITVSGGEYILPRIDAPDLLPSPNFVWSYVVREHTPHHTNPTLHDYIVAYIHDDINVEYGHYTLNDGSVSGITDDLSETPNPNSGGFRENTMPVVAFEDWWNIGGAGSTGGAMDAIYYGWYLNHGDAGTNLSNRDDALIGLKLKSDGFLYTGWVEYNVIPNVPDDCSSVPALAFSGNNGPEHGGLYIAFTQEGVAGNRMMGYKYVDWTGTEFRPELPPTRNNIADGLSVYPNPFTQGFTIKLPQDKGSTYSLSITDMLGRNILNLSGTIETLNKEVADNELESGHYILRLQNKETGNIYTVQLVGIKK